MAASLLLPVGSQRAATGTFTFIQRQATMRDDMDRTMEDAVNDLIKRWSDEIMVKQWLDEIKIGLWLKTKRVDDE